MGYINGRKVSVFTGLVVLSYSLAKLFIYAQEELYLRTTAMAFLGWSSYLYIHYLETGQLIDRRKEEKKLPESESNWMVLGVSAVLFALGMAFGSLGVNAGETIPATVGAASVMTGYFVAHYEFSNIIV
jgi:hypothetical protein